MPADKPIKRIAIIGTGVIGASWAAQYLARGFDVVAADPARNAESNLRQHVDDAWSALTTLGLAPNASRDRLEFADDAKEAVSNADFVQENGPERPGFKIKLTRWSCPGLPAPSGLSWSRGDRASPNGSQPESLSIPRIDPQFAEFDYSGAGSLAPFKTLPKFCRAVPESPLKPRSGESYGQSKL